MYPVSLLGILVCIISHRTSAQPPIPGFPFYPPVAFSIFDYDYTDTTGFKHPLVHGRTNLPGSGQTGHWGNILIADTGNNRVIEVNPSHFNNGSDSGNNQDNHPNFEEDIISYQLGYHNPDYDTDNGDFPAPAPCNYEPHNTVNGPVWAQWLQSNQFSGGSYFHYLLVVVAGFDGCPDNRVRVFIVNHYDAGNERFDTGQCNRDANWNCSLNVWTFGGRLPGSGPLDLDHPTHATQLTFDDDYYSTTNNNNTDDPGRINNQDYYSDYIGCQEHKDYYFSGSKSGDIMITDQGNNRIVLVDFCTQEVEWVYGPKHGTAALNGPTMTQQLLTGNILIADTGNNRIIEITTAGNYVSQYTLGLARPQFVSRIEYFSPDFCECDSDNYNCDCHEIPLCDPNYCRIRNVQFDAVMNTQLITDTGNNRLIQLRNDSSVKFVHHDPSYGKIVMAVPVYRPGFYLITDQGKSRVIVWDPVKDRKLFILTDLNHPSSAVVVGEETGLTTTNYWTNWLENVCC